MQFLQSGVQERHLQCQTISKNMLWGWIFKAFKTSGNWWYLIKRPSGRQCGGGRTARTLSRQTQLLHSSQNLPLFSLSFHCTALHSGDQQLTLQFAGCSSPLVLNKFRHVSIYLFILIRCTMHLLLFCTVTNKCTVISQIITLLHVSTLSCHPQAACKQYLPSYTSLLNAAVGNTVYN